MSKVEVQVLARTQAAKQSLMGGLSVSLSQFQVLHFYLIILRIANVFMLKYTYSIYDNPLLARIIVPE